MHCFSMPDRLDECLAEGWWISFAGNVTYPKATDLAEAAERVPDDRLLVETDAPYLTPQPVRKERNQPAFVTHTARFVAERRGVVLRGARAPRRRQRCHALRVVTGELPTQPSLRRMRQFGVRPKRDLGQNFLIDSNILGVIERAAELGRRRRRARDRRRAGRAQRAPGGARRPRPRRRARPRARARARGRARARTRTRRCTSPTRSSSTSRALRAGADQGRRQPPLRHRGERDPAHHRGARRRHALGGHDPARGRRALRRRARAPPAYGVPSVLAQLACDVRVHRSIARTVFHPVPNVDSVLVVLDRTGPAAPPALRALVRAAFAHRRKALARSLALAPGHGPDVRDRARAGPAGARPPGRRARRAPRAEEFRALAEALAVGHDRGCTTRRRPRSTSASTWARRAPTAATSS